MDKELAAARRAFEAGNLSGLWDALVLCEQEGCPLPSWVHSGLHDTLLDYFWGSKEGPKWFRHWRQAVIDLDRYGWVVSGRAAREGWEGNLTELQSMLRALRDRTSALRAESIKLGDKKPKGMTVKEWGEAQDELLQDRKKLESRQADLSALAEEYEQNLASTTFNLGEQDVELVHHAVAEKINLWGDPGLRRDSVSAATVQRSYRRVKKAGPDSTTFYFGRMAMTLMEQRRQNRVAK